MSICTPQELKEKLERGESILVVDVRTAGELKTASLPGVTHVPLDQLNARVGELEAWKDKEVIVMCHHGMRSQMAQEFLQGKGFKQVRNLTGGIDAYSVQADSSIPRY